MKYLSLNNDELRELINLKKGSFIGYLIFFGIIAIASFLISDHILPANTELGPYAVATLFALSYLCFFFYSNRSYFEDLLKKEKKVYKGVLSRKSYKSREDKYQLHMDGNVFIVDKESYNAFSEGDIVEFHISARTKHLFKVEKVSETL
ncbi:MAG TPA: hypothetical protein VNB90_06645 [Cytophagaceae bacterium]|jgi:hypothetical protein|nr:hypothetical protein [Cytophagaceae bacterium]